TVTGSSNPSSVGTVTFKNGATTICSAVPLTSNTATCSPVKLPVGTYSLTAEYSGATGFTSSTSSALNQTVTAKSITVTAVASTKGYDGTTSSLGTPTITGTLAAGDTANF